MWWDLKGVIYYKLLKPGKTIVGERHWTQLISLNAVVKKIRPECAKRHNRIILQQDKARLHISKVVETYLGRLDWEILPHPPYSPDITPPDYYLLRFMSHALVEKRFSLLRTSNNERFVDSVKRWRVFSQRNW